MSLGRYDADSIMPYPDKPAALAYHKLGLPYQRERLSNGDKIGLNDLYPPAKRPGVYNPKKGKKGLYYCERYNMKNNDVPFGTIGVDGYCGPSTGQHREKPAYFIVAKVVLKLQRKEKDGTKMVFADPTMGQTATLVDGSLNN